MHTTRSDPESRRQSQALSIVLIVLGILLLIAALALMASPLHTMAMQLGSDRAALAETSTPGDMASSLGLFQDRPDCSTNCMIEWSSPASGFSISPLGGLLPASWVGFQSSQVVSV